MQHSNVTGIIISWSPFPFNNPESAEQRQPLEIYQRRKKRKKRGSAEQESLLKLPLVDLSALDPDNPTGQEWDTARAKVVQALESHGCFDAVYDRVGPVLRDELFGRAIPELFAPPLDVKLRNCSSDGTYINYIGQVPDMAYESLRVDSAPTIEGAQGFTNLLWPDGNPSFCNTIWTFAKHMQELTKMVHRMVLQSLGLEKYFDCHIEPKTSGLRLSEYGIPLDQEIKAGMPAHMDPHMLTIVCQHQIEGLEVQTKEGEWIHVVPLPNSFTVMTGEAFKVWTNGRFQPPLHRVKMTGNEKRYSALFGMRPSDDCMMQPLNELASDDHRLLFKPFNYKEYIKFRFSEEGKKCKDPLEAFCGIGSET